MRNYFDIETAGLDQRKHKVWVACFIGDEPDSLRTFSVFGPTANEGGLIFDTFSAIKGTSELVSWNGYRFDVPFLEYRARKYGLDMVSPQIHVDLGLMTKARYGLTYWSQERVMAHYGIPTNPYPFSEAIWSAAGRGDQPSQDYIVSHCEWDVKALRSLYNVLMVEEPDAIGTEA